jgi:metallo-beta-lactamase class B
MKRFAAVLGLLLAIVAAHAEDSFAQKRLAWNRPAAPFHVIANIYYVGMADFAVYLVVTPKGHILIDGGAAESPPLIEKNIAALGFKLSDIKVIIDTHAHFDHAGGLAELQQKTHAKIVAGMRDTATLERGYITYGPSAPVHFTPVHADRAVKDGDRLSLGGVTLTAVATPGHTAGCTSWTMKVRENGVKHNVVFVCSITVGGNPLVGNADYPEIVPDFRRSFAVMKALKADVFLPGHARFFDAHGKAARAKAGGANPFVDAGALRRYAEAAESEFNAELARQQAARKP